MSSPIDPINTLAQALGTANQYMCRLMVTTREEAWEGTIEAPDTDGVVREVRSMIENYQIRTDNGIEGDELLYITQLDPEDDEIGDEIEIDMRAEGEPFSWAACALVKDLAKVDIGRMEGTFADFVKRARSMLEKHDDIPAAEPAAS